MDKFLDIDYLVANNTRMYYFGLGFIQVVLNKYERVHFYSDQLPVTNEEPHNHRYNFESTILKGNFFEQKYLLLNGDTHILTNETCNPNQKPTNDIAIDVKVDLYVPEFHYKEGQSYSSMFNEFHTVRTEGNTITYLKRSDIITDYAQVLQKKGEPIVCPFEANDQYSVNMLWELVENTIKN